MQAQQPQNHLVGLLIFLSTFLAADVHMCQAKVPVREEKKNPTAETDRSARTDPADHPHLGGRGQTLAVLLGSGILGLLPPPDPAAEGPGGQARTEVVSAQARSLPGTPDPPLDASYHWSKLTGLITG